MGALQARDVGRPSEASHADPDPTRSTGASDAGEPPPEDNEGADPHTFWWEVSRNAAVAGDLTALSVNCRRTRSDVSFLWSFAPTAQTAAVRSPPVEWLGMTWTVRFQKSPFDTGIPHRPAWSLFLDLHPPYHSVRGVFGTVALVLPGRSNRQLWQFDRVFAPAWPGQEICTWCCRRLNMHEFVQLVIRAKGAVRLKVKLASVGKALGYALPPPGAEVEELPFPVKVGTTTVRRRFVWDLRRHLRGPADFIDFWKELRGLGPRGLRRVRFEPVDVVRAVPQWEISGVCTHRVCAELREVVVRAVHDHVNGFVVLPYHVPLVDFDMMDGSDDEGADDDEGSFFPLVCASKLSSTLRMLDWIVQYPLHAAFRRQQLKCGGGKGGVPPQGAPSHGLGATGPAGARQSQEPSEGGGSADAAAAGVPGDQGCAVCSQRPSTGLRTCSGCHSRHYCSRECQKAHWKSHKTECPELLQIHRRACDAKRARAEEEARMLQDSLCGSDAWSSVGSASP